MQRMFTHTYHVPGNLAADLNIRFTAPCDMQLVHVSHVGSGATSTALLNIGPSTDTDGYLDDVVMGKSGVPAEYDRDDFVNGEYPHIVKGTIVCILVTYNTLATAADWTGVFTFTEG